MSMSRQELRGTVSRIEAAISVLRLRYANDAKFFQSTDSIFTSVFSNAHHEDDDWLAVMVDEVCTRQGMPYPAM
ncbi:hypothetical protein SAMN05216570_4218 [Dyella sp. OK004]|uniref:hypothetical protein n=1 Tax=Dyella sp. OK004 TaxID=1855292 RepID=UPI0008EE1BA8|nr:hypothetical protein [Dyella sp. OK004]SFS19986.1 hypothetical protein SAMN05216570_4218 [Dyella sp. OK004]